MEQYEIKKIIINERVVSLGSGFVYLERKRFIKIWSVELFKVEDDDFFYDLIENNTEVQLLIEVEERYVRGQSMLTNVSTGPAGTRVLLQGTGPLFEINNT